jgi:hypothetical protein
MSAFSLLRATTSWAHRSPATTVVVLPPGRVVLDVDDVELVDDELVELVELVDVDDVLDVEVLEVDDDVLEVELDVDDDVLDDDVLDDDVDELVLDDVGVLLEVELELLVDPPPPPKVRWCELWLGTSVALSRQEPAALQSTFTFPGPMNVLVTWTATGPNPPLEFVLKIANAFGLQTWVSPVVHTRRVPFEPLPGNPIPLTLTLAVSGKLSLGVTLTWTLGSPSGSLSKVSAKAVAAIPTTTAVRNAMNATRRECTLSLTRMTLPALDPPGSPSPLLNLACWVRRDVRAALDVRGRASRPQLVDLRIALCPRLLEDGDGPLQNWTRQGLRQRRLEPVDLGVEPPAGIEQHAAPVRRRNPNRCRGARKGRACRRRAGRRGARGSGGARRRRAG